MKVDGYMFAHHQRAPSQVRKKSEVHYESVGKHGLETGWFYDGRPAYGITVAEECYRHGQKIRRRAWTPGGEL